MAESDTHEAEAELRISRVKALSDQDILGVVTYLLAKYPETFPGMLDDALSSVSPGTGG
jgi:hypothetical protein